LAPGHWPRNDARNRRPAGFGGVSPEDGGAGGTGSARWGSGVRKNSSIVLRCSSIVVFSTSVLTPLDETPTGSQPAMMALCLSELVLRSSPQDGLASVMSVPDKPHTSSTHGDVLTAISDGMVALLREFYGRGPSRAKSYYHDDLVVCVLRGGFSRVEQTLLAGGRGAAVIQQRMEFQDVMRARFSDVVERATGRRVIGFMSGNQQAPDLMCETFILAPTDLFDDDGQPTETLPLPG
jgi:uncharacterized protein YbcI